MTFALECECIEEREGTAAQVAPCNEGHSDDTPRSDVFALRCAVSFPRLP